MPKPIEKMELGVSLDTIEGITKTLAGNCENVMKRSQHHKNIDVETILGSYVETILHMLLPRSEVVRQTELYKKLKDAQDHLRHDEAASIQADLASIDKSEDVVELRTQATAYLRSFVSPDYHQHFDTVLSYEQPKPRAVVMLHYVGESAVKGFRAARAAFS